MHRIALLVLPENIPVITTGTLDVIAMANILAGPATPAFHVTCVGAAPSVGLMNGVSVACGATFADEQPPYDTVLVPGLLYDALPQTVARHTQAVAWLQRQLQQGSHVGSMCVGAFLVAATGWLDGKRTTLHWAYADDFRRMFPAVNVTTDPLVVDNGNLFSGGGASGYLNLLLYFIDRTMGREPMLQIARMLLIDPDKVAQNQYSLFTAYKQHGDEPIRHAQEQLEQSYAREPQIQTLADAAAISPRHFLRRFKSATGLSPVAYLQKVRVEAARQALANSDDRIAEIQMAVGYEDEKTFRSLFRRHTGLSPSAYRQKFRSQALRFPAA